MLPGSVGAYDGSHRPNKLFVSLAVVTLIALGVGGYFLYDRYLVPAEDIVQPEEAVAPAPVTESTLPKTVASEPVPLLSDANYQSENFRVGEIAIGGEAEFVLDEAMAEPLSVSGIRGEAFTEKNRPEVKLVLSWKTNRLARSQISYSKGVGQPEKTVAEDDYSFNHSIVIPGLDQASTYVYAITAYDRFGGETRSESHAVYTGSKTVSLFDLIAGAVGDVFGWAVKK